MLPNTIKGEKGVGGKHIPLEVRATYKKNSSMYNEKHEGTMGQTKGFVASTKEEKKEDRPILRSVRAGGGMQGFRCLKRKITDAIPCKSPGWEEMNFLRRN